jgi:hypothetical protein
MLTFAAAHLLEGRLVAQGVLARFDDEGESGRDGLGRLCCLGFFCRGHGWWLLEFVGGYLLFDRLASFACDFKLRYASTWLTRRRAGSWRFPVKRLEARPS